jgi:hypothetical protein
MIETPRGTLETSIGTVNFAMTEAAHVYLNSDGSKGQLVTIRGIPYHVSCHLHLVDGQWTVKDYHDPYMSRKDCFNKDASQAARKTARETLAKVWTEYLAAHAGLSREAEQAKAAEQVERLESELADLESKAAAKRTELKAAKKAQAAV